MALCRPRTLPLVVIVMNGIQDQVVRSRAHADIEVSLVAIRQALEQFGDLQACILHCMQPHRPDFYRRIEQDFGVRVRTNQQRSGFTAAVGKAALGLPALIVLTQYEELPRLFSRISEQAVAALYVVPMSTEELLAKLAHLSASAITAEIKGAPAHFLYQVDEDAVTTDGRTVEVISTGPDCPQALKAAIGIMEGDDPL
jgi:hypothetical protein